MSTFEEYQSRLLPAGLAGPYGLGWGRAHGAAKDALASAAKDATKARMVHIAPSDALPRLAADRQLDRAPGEGSESWRARIIGAWESWSWLGTRYGIAYAVSLLGLGTPAVWTWHMMPWDTDASRWARIRVAFTGRFGGGIGAWGSATWGARLVQAIETADPTTARQMLRPVLRKWINARDRVHTVTIHRGNAIWGRFVWGELPWASATSTSWGPPAWGSSEATWGGFALGVFG